MPLILLPFYQKVFYSIAVNNVYIQKHCFNVKLYYMDFVKDGNDLSISH